MVSVSSHRMPESIFSGVATGSDVMVEFMVVEATKAGDSLLQWMWRRWN